MADRLRTVEEISDVLGRIDLQHLRYEFRKAAEIREWAIAHAGIDFGVGDQVEICDDFAARLKPDSGWYTSREALAEGATATVEEIDFYKGWYAKIVLNREWTVHKRGDGEVVRHWTGSTADTPDGYEPPSRYDQEHYPVGRKHSFMMRVEHLQATRVTRESVPSHESE